jgi:hypothetical protein
MTDTTVKKRASSAKSSATTDAQRRAAVILEVLAGIRTAGEAARLLKISPNSYYIAERKALSGLVAACEPAPRRGPTPDLERQVQQLERALARCQRECQRQAALVRATQRAVGLPVTPAPEAAGTNGSPAKRSRKGKTDRGKLRRRRHVPRGVRAARALQKAIAPSEPLEVQQTSPSPSKEESPCLKEERPDDSSRT